MMTLRLATEKDEEEVLRMAKAFHEASPYRDLEFDPVASSGLFKAYLDDKTRLIIILSEQEDRPRGMVIGMCSTPLFSSSKMSTEIAWWMDPEFRRTRDSLLLIEAYQDWSRRVGAKIIQVAMLDELTDLSGFYTKKGYRPAERSFIRNSDGSI